MVVGSLIVVLLVYLEVMVAHLCLGSASGGQQGAGGRAVPAGGGQEAAF